MNTETTRTSSKGTRIFLLKNRSCRSPSLAEAPSRMFAWFRRLVWAHYKKYGRHNLPWRKTKDPYKILVSEVMLQQTRAERVIPFYAEFTKRFPTAQKLAEAPLPDVLESWQGLGYNRRAKLLRDAAQELIHTPLSATRSNLVQLVQRLEELPGVGPYTARAVVAFAYNQDVVFVETNIRTAIIHHFFSRRRTVKDAELIEMLKRALPKGKAREWYSALMDYGAHLKRSGISHNAKSATYTKQATFAGSLREARGAALRAYMQGVTSRTKLINLLGPSRRAQARVALYALEKEGLIQ